MERWSKRRPHDYLRRLFGPQDRIAVVAVPRGSGRVAQRFPTAAGACGARFQGWLRHLNAQGYDIFVGVNPVGTRQRREKQDIVSVRRLQLDLDENGGVGLKRVLDDIEHGKLPSAAGIDKSDIDVREQQGDRAYYSPKADVVVLPDRGQFPTAGDYYRTALHELGHATGHKDRLDRETLQQGTTEGFGSPAYAREELRAEISSMMTGERIGIGHEPHHGAAYVKSWVAVLKDDPGEIRRAASDAQRMADYLTERPRVREALEREQSRPEPPALAEPDRSPQLPERTRRDQPEREHELEHSR